MDVDYFVQRSAGLDSTIIKRTKSKPVKHVDVSILHMMRMSTAEIVD